MVNPTIRRYNLNDLPPKGDKVTDLRDHSQGEFYKVRASIDSITDVSNTLSASVDGLSAAVITLQHSIGPICQGRLTLVTGVPVMSSTVSAQTRVFYTPYIGEFGALWNGTSFVPVDLGGELFQDTTDATKSPAAVVANENYDMFLWQDAATKRCTRGPPWSTGGGSATARGTGAGSTQLQNVQGTLTNAFAITNGPAAGFGTYVGSIRSNGTSTIDFIFGGTANGGTAVVFNVWNAYNRVLMQGASYDNTFYTYAPATVRQAHGSAGNQVSFLCGLREDEISAWFQTELETLNVANAQANACMGFDSTTAFFPQTQRLIAFAPTANFYVAAGCVMFTTTVTLGSHRITGLDQGDGVNANTFNANGTMGLILQGKF